MAVKPKKDPRRLVTITAAISGGVAGWCAKIIAPPEPQVDRTAIFRELADDPLEAEVKAAACGLTLASARGLLYNQPLILLQMASAEAIAVMLASDARYEYSGGPMRAGGVPHVSRADHVPARCIAAVAAIRKVRDETGATLWLRLVTT